MVGCVFFTFGVLNLRHLMGGSPEKMQLIQDKLKLVSRLHYVIISYNYFCLRVGI